MTYLLDTCVVVNFLRGRTGSKDLFISLSGDGSFAVSVITYGELQYGAHRSGNFKREQERVADLVNDFRIAVLPLTQSTIELFAAVKFEMERKGSKLDDFDLLIGATAVSSGSTLVTDNMKHFQQFPGIVLTKRTRAEVNIM